MKPMSPDHSKLRHALINKLDLFDDRTVRDNEIAEAVGKVIKERDEAVQVRDEFFERVSAQLQIPQGEHIAYESYVEIFESVKELRYERDAALERSDAEQLLERCKQASEKNGKFSYDEEDISGMTLGDIPKLVAYSFQARNEIVDLTKRVTATPDEAQSQISEITKTLVEADLMRRNVNSSVEVLVKERDALCTERDEYHAQLMEVATRLGDPGAFFSSLPSEITKLHTEMARVELACENYRVLLARPDATQPQLNELMTDELLDRLGLVNGYTPEQFHVSMKVLFNDLSTLQEQVETLKTDIEYRRTTQLSEIRYVLHGGIQPCSVLYSDDTTTLLRLDEGDMMLETDTIEWSDSVTYRCQELLKASGLNKINLVRVSGHLAQLVRDERILLNDDAELEDESGEGTYTICVQCEQVFQVNLDLCPHCHTAKGPLPLTLDDAELEDEELLRSAINYAAAPMVVPSAPAVPTTPSCGKPYVHDNIAYPEDAMRAAGWQTEDLVQKGYGHYKPALLQRPQEH